MLVSVTAFVEAATEVEYYLDEVSGSVAADSSSNGNDGTVVNAPVDDSQWVAGADGGGLYLDGTDYLLTDVPVTEDHSFTISCYVSAPSTLGTGNTVYSEFKVGVRSLFNMRCSWGKLNVWLSDDNTTVAVNLTSSATVFDNSWHHVALVNDSGNVKLYVDGQLDNTATYDPAAFSFTAPDKAYVGARGYWVNGVVMNYYTSGKIDMFTAIDEVDSSMTLVTEAITYQSTVSSDGNGPLDLIAELNYDTGFVNAPIVVVMHGYAQLIDSVRENAQRLRDAGFFAISVAMRERDGSDGIRDSGGLEIHDIYDAVEYVKSNYSNFVNPDNVHITGYSGGGGNTMSALTKFPDYFRVGAAFFGMSDYGYDHTNGWYFNGANSFHQSHMRTDIGDPTLGSPPIDDEYAARASNLASKNNPYSEIHLFVNHTESTCPPVNDTTYRDNAIANESFSGEFDNITVHIGGYGEYEDFNNNGVDDPDELQDWPHGLPNADQQHASQAWYLDRLLSGQIPQPVLNPSDELYVAGYVKTRQFTLWLGNGENAAATLTYNLTPNIKEFALDILTNDKTIQSEISVDLSDTSGRVYAKVNDIVVQEFDGGGVFTYSTLEDGNRLVLTIDDCGMWGYNPMDFNHDCTVDIEDLSLFSREWLKCSDPSEIGCESYN